MREVNILTEQSVTLRGRREAIQSFLKGISVMRENKSVGLELGLIIIIKINIYMHYLYPQYITVIEILLSEFYIQETETNSSS